MNTVMLAMFVILAAVGSVAGSDWSSLSQTSTGPGTIYGAATDAGGTSNARGACSFGTNFADTTGLPWSTAPSGASDGGTGLSITYVAMNNVDFAASEACGACIWFRGTGPGDGVASKAISTNWQYGLVDNECPECPKGAIDLARSFDVGNGIWTTEWYAVPCQVGNTPLHYTFVQSSPYYFNLVISNTAVPVEAVSIDVGGSSVALTRTNNNFWAYHNSDGDFTFPMSITVTPVCGSPVTDSIASLDGGAGSKQFTTDGCSSQGNPTGGSGGGSSSSSGSSSGGGNGALSTEATSAARATMPRHLDSGSMQREVLATTPPAAVSPPVAPAPAQQAVPPRVPNNPPPVVASPPQQQPPSQSPPSQQPPAQAPPIQSPPVQSPPAQSPPAQTPPVQSPPVQSPPAQSPPAQSPPAQSPPAQSPPAQSPPSLEAPPAATPPAQTPPMTKSQLSDTMRNLFGGFLDPKTGVAVLPAWYQCGDTQGQYPAVACGNDGFDCVYINYYYWQCRNDAGGPSVQGRKRAASRRLLRGDSNE